MDDTIFSLNEVSKYLNIPKSTLYVLSQTNKMPSLKIGKQLRFRKSSIDKWLTERESSRALKGSLVVKATNPQRILLIDDDQLVLKTLANFLRIHGYNVEPVDSGEAALKRIRESNYSLVITDIRMPGLNGIETIKRIRELTASQNKPSPKEIIITGYADMAIEQEAERLGITKRIYKPFVTEEFIKAIEDKLS